MSDRKDYHATPHVEIVAIGTELVMGRVLDTNTHWLESQVVDLGGHVRRAIAIEDDADEILDVLRDCVRRRTNVVITTGGLGPTPDDLTSQCLGTLARAPVAPHEPTLDDFINRRALASREELTPNLVRMATVPICARIHPNPVGWAPCIDMEVEDTRIFAIAGPPKEMEGVFTAHVAPVIADLSPMFRLAERVTVDLWESELSPLIETVMQRFPGSYIKGYVAQRDERLPVDVIVADADRDLAAGTLNRAVLLLEELLNLQGRTLERTNGRVV